MDVRLVTREAEVRLLNDKCVKRFESKRTFRYEQLKPTIVHFGSFKSKPTIIDCGSLESKPTIVNFAGHNNFTVANN